MKLEQKDISVLLLFWLKLKLYQMSKRALSATLAEADEASHGLL